MHDTEDGDMTIRGHVVADDLPEIVNGYDTDMTVAGPAWFTWAHAGFYVNDDGDVCGGGVHIGNRYAGKRGSFAVTVVEVGDVTDG